MKQLFLFFFFCFMCASAGAQSSVSFVINPKSVSNGQSFEAEILASGLTNVVSIGLSIQWDSTKLKFEELSGVSTVIPFVFNTTQAGSGVIGTSWFDVQSPKTLPSNSILFKLKFKAIVAGVTTISFTSSPVAIEVINSSLNTLPHVVSNGQITILQTSSSIEQDFSQARIFPNPCTDFIQLDLSEINQYIAKISIMDTGGRIVKTVIPAKAVNHESNNSLLINTSDLTPGNYWMKYNSGSKTAMVPFVRQ